MNFVVPYSFSYCLLPTAYCLLPTAYCLLPTAYCLLPTAYCLLPTAYCPLPSFAHKLLIQLQVQLAQNFRFAGGRFFIPALRVSDREIVVRVRIVGL